MLPNNDCPTNFQGEFYHMSPSNTQSQSTKQKQPSRNLRSLKNAAALPAASPVTAQAETVISPATASDPSVRYVGLDVHKKQITYCILDRDGVTLREGEIMLTRERLTHFAKDILQPTDRVALESTTNCWAVVQHLQPHVPNVVVSNPMATKAIAHSKIKTDKVDAKVLAQLLRCDFLPTVWQPDEATRLRRQLTGRRASLVGQRTQLQNRIHSVLAMRLIIPRLARLAYDVERVKLLMTIPGVSIVVGQALVAAFGDITRFESGDSAASYLGLTPSTRQSANTVYHGPITKHGNSTARMMLFQAAQQYSRQAGPLGHFFQRLKRRKCHNVAVVVTARKLAIIAWRLLTTGEPYRYAQPAATATKLASLRIAASGEKRRGGSPRGVKPTAKLPGGSKTIRSLDDTYENEGLPVRSPLPPGEVRHLQETGSVNFVDKIGKSQLLPRKSKPNAQTAKNTGRQPEISQSEK